MRLGTWCQIADVVGSERPASQWTKLIAPDRYLLNFCHHVAGWLPRGDWKLFQIDNSTGQLDPVQMSLVSGLLYGVDGACDLNEYQDRGFLFEFNGRDSRADDNVELAIANLVFVFVLFRLHAYVVSSGSRDGELVGLQDGVVYLSSRHGPISEIDSMRERLAREPSTPPEWILNVIARHQEHAL